MGTHLLGTQRQIGLKQDTFQYVPLSEGLKSLLANKEIFLEVKCLHFKLSLYINVLCRFCNLINVMMALLQMFVMVSFFKNILYFNSMKMHYNY